MRIGTPDAIDFLALAGRKLSARIEAETIPHQMLASQDFVDASDLSITRAKPEGAEAQDTNFTLLEGVERNAIIQMLKDTGGNKLEAAKRLGIGRQTLYNKIKAYGIEV